GAMPALAFQNDLETICCGHHGAHIDADRAGRQRRPVVKRVDRVAGKDVEEAIFYHGLRTTPPFFGRLKDQYCSSVEIPRGGKISRSAQQYRRMPVMPAAMHQSRLARTMGKVVVLDNGQSVHIRAQPDHAAAIATTATHDTNHA